MDPVPASDTFKVPSSATFDFRCPVATLQVHYEVPAPVASSTEAEAETPRPVFPPEITDRIIDYLHSDKEALKACSLVCREWTFTTRIHLFRHITCATKPGSILLFSHSLRRFARLVHYVQELDVEGTEFSTSWSELRFMRSLKLAAVRSARFRNIRFSHFGSDVEHQLLHRMPALRRLEMKDCTFEYMRDLLEFLHRYSAMKAVVLDSPDYDRFVDDPIKQPERSDEDFRLLCESLSLTEAMSLDSFVVPLFKMFSCPFLQSLELYGEAFFSLLPAEDVCKEIGRLVVHLRVKQSQECRLLEELRSHPILAHFRRLQTFRFESNSLFIAPLEVTEDSPKFLPTILSQLSSPNIRLISVGAVEPSWFSGRSERISADPGFEDADRLLATPRFDPLEVVDLQFKRRTMLRTEVTPDRIREKLPKLARRGILQVSCT